MKRFVLWSVGIIFGLFVLCIVGYLVLYYVSNRPEFTTEELPKATINQPYYAKIEMSNNIAHLIISTSTNDILVEPKVYESHKNIYNEPVYRKDYSDLTITGTPTKLEPITIQLEGYTYGTMISGKHFNKEYVIEVVE